MSTTLPKTMKAYTITEFNGSLDAVKFGEIPLPTIGDDDLLVKNKYAGLNFFDKFIRRGFIPLPPNSVIGTEGSGEVVAVGKNIKDYKIGDKLAYSGLTYAEYTKLTPGRPMCYIFKLPADVSDELLKFYGGLVGQGLTATVITEEAYDVKKGDYILIHAAAGGVGSMLCQIVKNRGAHAIGVASTDEKLKFAQEAGAEFLINSSTDDIVAKVQEFTGGKGVNACFDSVGKDTFEASFASLANKGTFVSFGQASGALELFDLSRLSAKSLKIVKPALYSYISSPEEWEYHTSRLSKLVNSGELKPGSLTLYPFSEYKKAAEALESRKSTGKLLLKIY